MKTLKKLFPLSWKYTKDVPNFIIGIIIQAVASILAGAVISLATMLVELIPAVGGLLAWLIGIVGSLVGLYFLAGIVIQILVFTKVIKD